MGMGGEQVYDLLVAYRCDAVSFELETSGTTTNWLVVKSATVCRSPLRCAAVRAGRDYTQKLRPECVKAECAKQTAFLRRLELDWSALKYVSSSCGKLRALASLNMLVYHFRSGLIIHAGFSSACSTQQKAVFLDACLGCPRCYFGTPAD